MLKLDLLVSIYIFCIAAAELMGAKTIPLMKLGTYQLNASVALLVIPVIFSINDIVSEVYGKERARSIVRSGIIVVALILLFSLLATNLPPSTRFEMREAAYDQIFGLSARIAAASLTAFTIAEFLDVFLFAKIRQLFGKKRLWLRNNVSNIISQFVDTTVFMALAFYEPGNIGFVWSLILPYWLLKCFMSVIETPFVYLGVAWLKKP
ncbi:MAG: hypothetical protein ACD_9C00075G0003 [uncultured bacterium]|uniref:Probable queuosine precursor transporter n=1 Tax=Candidatus Gottesmanbacteria bacterium RIFCSPLOWO2_01_FULL_43_11b TaxID=1798392 RepID=A0A1F6AIN7_9BACT|nr:MAG: hypothetical protein ACD_9C00075G0003 [uncultured bacterium]OGG24342.1 MAG: hypothetical protein A3A79_04115 [Candidatus Gottesmanbacteria bacterium RIFCSPLOWO2_01_FULL_43_11b]